LSEKGQFPVSAHKALGVIGQTIAGLVSLTSLVMVWTGLALAGGDAPQEAAGAE
jgi:hypothetical protein